MAHHGQHAMCEMCDRAAGFAGNHWDASVGQDGSVLLCRVWWSRGSCAHRFRVAQDGAVYDCLFSPRRIDAGSAQYVSPEDQEWAQMAAAIARRLIESGKTRAVYMDDEPKS